MGKKTTIRCSVCNSKSATLYKPSVRSVYSKKSYDLMHCSKCDHYFTNPVFTEKELNDIYSNAYSYDAHSLIKKEKQMRARKYAEYIANLDNVSSALEVGCMHGLLLTELQSLGLSVSGVELDPEAAQYCRNHGLEVVQSSIEDHLKHAQSKDDVIIMSHVIEHIADPEKQLKELHKRMSDDGRLVLITPNSNAKTRKLFGRYWGYWQVPVHINHFNKSSMKKLLEKAGFSITDHKTYGGDSLFFLSSLANLVGASNDTQTLSRPKKALVKIATVLLKPWYFVGSEDMVVVASKSA